ncbi:MAG: beta-lactamase family protein [Acidobacteria bacterium]|nr:beta-lactamase family protein [Acidobacteriota bacterium]
MPRQTAILLALLVLGSASSKGQPHDRAAAVDALFADFASGNTPGCAVGVVQRGKVVLAKAYGLADLEHRIPLTPQSAFYMASVSKQFMALSMLLLERDGRLRLDDGVRKYIPELPSYADDITLRHLLHHTSGVRDYLTLGSLAGYSSDYVWTERGALRMIGRQRHLNFPVGTEHLYSNSGYVLLSMVAQRATGRTLDEWAGEHLFSPLGMSSTRFQHDHSHMVLRRASGYIRQAGTPGARGVRAGVGDNTWYIGNSTLDVVGDGGLYSTLEDMLRWAANFDDGRLAPDLLSRMQAPGALKDGTAIKNGYGMGLARSTYRGLETISHGGGLVGYRTMFLRLPAEKTTVVCMCNASTANTGRLAQRVAELYVGHAMSPASSTDPAGANAPVTAGGPLSAELRKALVGAFYNAELDAIYLIREEGERLIVEAGDQPPVPIVGGPDRLRLERGGVGLVLDRDASGRVNGFTLDAGRVRGLLFTRR